MGRLTLLLVLRGVRTPGRQVETRKVQVVVVTPGRRVVKLVVEVDVTPVELQLCSNP